MKVEKERLARVYRRLIALYPKAFRERFGESMEQTFGDLCRERETAHGRITNGFAVWILAETAAGVGRENFGRFYGVFMESRKLRIVFSIAAGLLVTAPFVIMEWIYSNGFPHGVPLAIFNVLFIEAALLTFLVLSLFRTPYRNPVRAWLAPFALKLLLAIPLALSWTHIVTDQMPCFLGGRGC